MTKNWALYLLKMVFPQDNKQSIILPHLTEKRVYACLHVALVLYPPMELLPEHMNMLVRQVVQNTLTPINRTQWLLNYAQHMASRIKGEINEQYLYDSAAASMDVMDKAEWMVVTPEEAVIAEMECWDD